MSFCDVLLYYSSFVFFFSSRRRHTRCALVTGVQTCALPISINVNGVASQPRRPRNEAEAIATARSYVARGYSVDLGLGQINSRNMGWLGLTWDTVFKQCANVEAAG